MLLLRTIAALLLVSSLQLASPVGAEEQPAGPAETRVVEYLRANVRPGQPIAVSELYNTVFTAPEERAALDRLLNSFYKLPLFVAQQQKSNGRPPTLAEIAEQFRFRVPGEADVMLRILEGDPRLPRFLQRDPKTGEITRVDVEAILAHPQFGRALERSLAGFESGPAPAWKLTLADGSSLRSESLAGTPHLLYFWFSGCPPCAKTAPLLAELHERYAARGLRIVALNADAVLEVPVSAAERTAHARKAGWEFTQAEADARTLDAHGAVSVFPTFFFVDRKGTVVRQLVNFQEVSVLQAAAERALQ